MDLKSADFTFNNGSLTSSTGSINFGNEGLQTTGTLSIGSSGLLGGLTLNNDVITATNNVVGFSDNNLTTTGNLEVGDVTASAISGTDISASGNLTVGGTLVTGTILSSLSNVTLGQSANNKVVTQNAQGVVTIGVPSETQVLNVASHDGATAGLKLGGTLVTAKASEMNHLSGLTSSVQTGLTSRYLKTEVDNLFDNYTGAGTISTVGTLTSGSIDTNFGTINTESDITTTKKVTAGSVVVDNLLIDQDKIQLSNTDILTFTTGNVAVTGNLSAGAITGTSLTMVMIIWQPRLQILIFSQEHNLQQVMLTDL